MPHTHGEACAVPIDYAISAAVLRQVAADARCAFAPEHPGPDGELVPAFLFPQTADVAGFWPEAEASLRTPTGAPDARLFDLFAADASAGDLPGGGLALYFPHLHAE